VPNNKNEVDKVTAVVVGRASDTDKKERRDFYELISNVIA
jgi:hypothetical protein